MIFLALKTEFYKYLANKDHPWKYRDLADAMKKIISEDEYNDTYGRIRMYQALLLKQPESFNRMRQSYIR